MNALKLYIPRVLPRTSATEAPRTVDLSDGSPVRKLLAEAKALGITVEVDPLAMRSAGAQDASAAP